LAWLDSRLSDGSFAKFQILTASIAQKTKSFARFVFPAWKSSITSWN